MRIEYSIAALALMLVLFIMDIMLSFSCSMILGCIISVSTVLKAFTLFYILGNPKITR